MPATLTDREITQESAIEKAQEVTRLGKEIKKLYYWLDKRYKLEVEQRSKSIKEIREDYHDLCDLASTLILLARIREHLAPEVFSPNYTSSLDELFEDIDISYIALSLF